MASLRRSKAKVSRKNKGPILTKKRRKDGLDTPQSLPPRGIDAGHKKRLGFQTRGLDWESGGECNAVRIREGTFVNDENDEGDSEDKDDEVPPCQLAIQTEVGETSQQPTQGKGKGKHKVKGCHLPHIDDMIPDRDDGKIWGQAPEPKVLFGYKNSWARTIFQTYDHTKAVRVCQNQAAAEWKLSLEHEDVQTLVRNSGLYSLVENYLNPDTVTVNCFVERYHGETDTMHFPFGEMTLIPEDAYAILGLNVIGKSISEGVESRDLDWLKLHNLTEKLFGWDFKTSSDSFYVASNGSKTKTFKLTMLKKMFENTKARSLEARWDPAQIRYTAAAYLLYLLGTRAFPDSNGNRVSANFLQYLDPLEGVCGYSWGTAVMAHLMAEMRRASLAKTNQFVGNFTILQVWCYEHFPTLFKDCPFLKIKDLPEPDIPRAQRFEFHSNPKPGNKGRVIDMRLDLDAMRKEDVVFDTYKEIRGYRQIPRDVALYHGPLYHPRGYIMADPCRVMRQHGFKQLSRFWSTSDDNYLLYFSRCNSTPNKLHVVYDPEPEPTHWRERDPRHLVDISKWELAENGYEVDDSYMRDYLEWSHPYVVRPPSVEAPHQENPPVEIPPPPPPTMAQLLKTLGMVRRRLGKVTKMLGCKHKDGVVLSLQEIKELEEKLHIIEETDPTVKAMYGETRKAPTQKKQNTN